MQKTLILCFVFYFFCYAQAQKLELLNSDNCPDCQAGELALRVSETLEPAFSAIDMPPCKENLFELIPQRLNDLTESQSAFSFSTEAAKNRWLARIVDNLDNDIRHQFANRIDNTVSACVVLGVVLPPNATYQGYGLSVTPQSTAKTQTCNLTDGFCASLNTAGFTMTPRLFEVAGKQIIVTEFRNYESDTLLESETIEAHLTVYYRLAQ